MSQTEQKSKTKRAETRYQEHKLLYRGLNMDIVNICIDEEDRPIVEVKSTNRDNYLIRLNSIYHPESDNDLVTLLSILGKNPDTELDCVSGVTVELLNEGDNGDTMTRRLNR